MHGAIQRRQFCLFVLAYAAITRHVLGAEPPDAPSGAQLVRVERIWDQAPHNAFTDLIRFHDQWFCVFREGQDHVSPDGALRVIASADGWKWRSVARIESPNSDLRDAKICLTPNGELMLSGAEALHDRSKHTHQSLAWFSSDGEHWSHAVPIGDPDYWLWRTTWHQGQAYSIGYGCRENNQHVRLYRSQDGRQFETWVANLYDQGYPNESSIVFTTDNTAYCLLRRDNAQANGLLGISKPPYKEWTWKDLGQRLGGPHMIQLPDQRFVAAVRLHTPSVRTSLCWIDPEKGTMTEFLALPSGGDTSYPGLVWHEGHLWVSYYASHEGKTNIYMAQVRLPEISP